MSVLFPCPGCGRTRKADEGHHLCRECEGYPPTQRDSASRRDLDRDGSRLSRFGREAAPS